MEKNLTLGLSSADLDSSLLRSCYSKDTLLDLSLPTVWLRHYVAVSNAFCKHLDLLCTLEWYYELCAGKFKVRIVSYIFRKNHLSSVDYDFYILLTINKICDYSSVLHLNSSLNTSAYPLATVYTILKLASLCIHLELDLLVRMSYLNTSVTFLSYDSPVLHTVNLNDCNETVVVNVCKRLRERNCRTVCKSKDDLTVNLSYLYYRNLSDCLKKSSIDILVSLLKSSDSGSDILYITVNNAVSSIELAEESLVV